MTTVALVCFASPSGGQDLRHPPDTASHADSTIAQRKAAQKALPVDPREKKADDSDRAAAGKVLGAIHQRGDVVLWKALRRAANPAVRAHLIDLIAPSGITARVIAQRLRITSDAGERAALIRSLGEMTESQLSQNERESLVARLLQLYSSDPDAEVHSSIGWLLANRESDSALNRIDWKQLSAIQAVDSAMRKAAPRGRGWSVSADGQTMMVIRPTATFMMGAPLSEPRREMNELPHNVQIPRVFSIASKEVSVAQFQQFLSETGRRDRWLKATRERWPNSPDPARFLVDPRRPQFAVTWYEAAQYCNWLSAKAGIQKEQWVYPDSIGPGMRLPANYLHRTGYRLPTEAEWEFAARAGSTAAHFFGDGVTLLDRYAWYFVNANLHGWPVATKEPNQFGLFDMYGNAWEWVNDRWVDYKDRDTVTSDNEDPVLVITDDTPRVRRGGSWSYDKETTRSAHRGSPGGYRPPDRRDSVGFRVAQTLN